jgi:hypothetical protein
MRWDVSISTARETEPIVGQLKKRTIRHRLSCRKCREERGNYEALASGKTARHGEHEHPCWTILPSATWFTLASHIPLWISIRKIHAVGEMANPVSQPHSFPKIAHLRQLPIDLILASTKFMNGKLANQCYRRIPSRFLDEIPKTSDLYSIPRGRVLFALLSTRERAPQITSPSWHCYRPARAVSQYRVRSDWSETEANTVARHTSHSESVPVPTPMAKKRL